MARKIRISVEIYSHDPGDEYEDLPEGWDDWTKERQEDFLVALAKEALFEAAGSGATVVDDAETKYTVEAKRWAHGWELHIQDVGVTQAEKLDDAEATVRDYIALALEVPADSFAVEIVQAQ